MWMNTEIIALNANGQTFYTPWFPKGADNAVFTMEWILNTLTGSDPTVTVSVLHKNREDEGSAPAEVGTFAPLVGDPGYYEVNCTGLKELVRFMITIQPLAAGEGFIYRFLPPTWYEKAV